MEKNLMSKFKQILINILKENNFFNDNDDNYETYERCEWCNEIYPKSELKKEKDLGYLCNRCIKGLESREGPLTFEED